MEKSASSLPLIWVKVNNWVMETECRTYQCRKYVPGDVLNDPAEHLYQLRKRGIVLDVPQDSFVRIRRIAETDASSSPLSSSHQSAHGTATREASQGRSSSNAKSSVTAEFHAARIAPKPLESQS
jgi:hypothetical protein